MEKKELRADAAQFAEAELGLTPEALDAIDMVLAAGELVLMVMNAMVRAAAQHEAVVSLPAVGVNGGLGKAPVP